MDEILRDIANRVSTLLSQQMFRDDYTVGVMPPDSEHNDLTHPIIMVYLHTRKIKKIVDTWWATTGRQLIGEEFLTESFPYSEIELRSKYMGRPRPL